MDEQKRWLAGVFDRAAPSYDRVGESYHGYFARRLVERAAMLPGADLVDVACGRGAVLLAAAGAAGSLSGCDISPVMVDLARADLREAGIDSADLRVMDAERLDYPDAAFDVLTVAFALFFLPEPAQAAAEFHRVLRPGGRVAVSVWAEDDPDWQWESELLAAAGQPQRRAIVRPYDRSEEVLELLAGAGFTDLQAHHETSQIVFATEQQWWDWHWSFSLRGILEQLGEDAVDAFRRAAFARMADLRSIDGYRMRLNAWIVTGRR
jgi:ubiquinone/menaquinone biosynthesis C-methylase UbiE